MATNSRSLSPIACRAYKAKSWEIWLIGFARVFFGHIFLWDLILVFGVNFAVAAVIIVVTGYICLAFCLAEMASALPFTGGLYGYVRGILGPYWGFFIGCWEIMLSTVYLAVGILEFGTAVEQYIQQTIFPTGDSQRWCYVPIVFMFLINCIGGSLFWKSISLITITSIVIFVIFIFGSMKNLNATKYGNQGYQYAQGGPYPAARSFFAIMPDAIFFFEGLEMLPVAFADSDEPAQTIVRCLLSNVFVFAIMGILLVVITSFQYPGIDSVIYDTFPLAWGLSTILKMKIENAGLLFIPNILAFCCSTTYSSSRILHSMAESGLFPSFLSLTFGSNRTPINSILAICILCSFIVTMSLYLNRKWYGYIIYYNATIGITLTIFFISTTYIMFLRNYISIERYFRNPLGYVGAVIAICVFGLEFAGLLVFAQMTSNKGAPILLGICGGFILFFTICYFLFIQRNQKFSLEEERIFFKAYVMNVNRRLKDKQLRKKRHLKYFKNFKFSLSSSDSRRIFVTKPEAANLGYPQMEENATLNLRVKPAPRGRISPSFDVIMHDDCQRESPTLDFIRLNNSHQIKESERLSVTITREVLYSANRQEESEMKQKKSSENEYQVTQLSSKNSDVLSVAGKRSTSLSPVPSHHSRQNDEIAIVNEEKKDCSDQQPTHWRIIGMFSNLFNPTPGATSVCSTVADGNDEVDINSASHDFFEQLRIGDREHLQQMQSTENLQLKYNDESGRSNINASFKNNVRMKGVDAKFQYE